MESTFIRTLPVLFACALPGCVSAPPSLDRAAIAAKAAAVDRSDGISKDEAVALAQEFMLSHALDYDWIVARPKSVTEPGERNEWSIVFAPKEDGWGSGPRTRSQVTFEMMLPKIVWVHKVTGEIRVSAVSIKKKE
jgi:hypothetical protein